MRTALDFRRNGEKPPVFNDIYRQRTADILSTLRPDDLKTLAREELAFRAQAAEKALGGERSDFSV
ncbi:MAG: hypothetical protein R3D66_04830 [Alphaproteobacteria bacterium]